MLTPDWLARDLPRRAPTSSTHRSGVHLGQQRLTYRLWHVGVSFLEKLTLRKLWPSRSAQAVPSEASRLALLVGILNLALIPQALRAFAG